MTAQQVRSNCRDSWKRAVEAKAVASTSRKGGAWTATNSAANCWRRSMRKLVRRTRTPEVSEAAQAKAERIIEEELSGLGWSAVDLQGRRQGDGRKVAIAQRLRAETTMTLAWIAQRLHMGSPG